MASVAKVFNSFKNCRIKRSQAERWVNDCSYAWADDEHTSIRKLSVAEMRQARSEQARKREGLVYWVQGKDGKLIAKPYYAEIPGLSFKPSVSGLVAHRQGYRLLQETRQFVNAAMA